jgi:cysteine dioxygenase
MKINTIDKLVLALNTCAKDKEESCYLDVMENIKIPNDDWERLFMFKKDGPARVCLVATDKYQLFLSCYEKGQQGQLHDIDSKKSWIHPICGKFTEERYSLSKENERLEKVSSVLLTSQSCSYMQESKTIYRYINSYENRSVCLHLYSPPVLEWREYDESTGEAKLVEHPCDKLVGDFQYIK